MDPHVESKVEYVPGTPHMPYTTSGWRVYVRVGDRSMEGQAATSSDAEALRDKWERMLWEAKKGNA